MSPEALKSDCSNEDFGKDLWALGCIIYRFFEGMTPFRENSEKDTFKKIIDNEDIYFSSKTPSIAQDLILNLLEKEPSKRIGYKDIEEIKNHPFFKGILWNEMNQIMPPSESIILMRTNPNQLKKVKSCAKLQIANNLKLNLHDVSGTSNNELINIDSELNNDENDDYCMLKANNQQDDIKSNKSGRSGKSSKRHNSNNSNKKTKHKNTISTSNIEDFKLEEKKYIMNKENKESHRNSIIKKFKSIHEDTLVLECKLININH